MLLRRRYVYLRILWRDDANEMTGCGYHQEGSSSLEARYDLGMMLSFQFAGVVEINETVNTPDHLML